MNTQEAATYLIDISDELGIYSNSNEALLAKVNNLSGKELQALERDHANLIGPVQLLRLICIKKLLNGVVITSEEIELIKENLTQHNVDEYDFLTEFQKEAIYKYKEKSFHQWNQYLKILFPFFYPYDTRQRVYVALQVIINDVLNKLELTDWVCERTQKPKVFNYWGFEGANQYGDDRAVLMFHPKKIQDHRDAIQLVLYFQYGHIEAGLDSGSNFKIGRTQDLDKFSTYEDALNKLKEVKDRAIALNRILIGKSDTLTLRFKLIKMELDFSRENDNDIFALRRTADNSFVLYYKKEDGELLKLGDLKIIQKGMKDFNVNIQDSFAELDDSHCSLGDQSYYEALQELDERQRNSILKALRDYVYDNSIFAKFEKSTERKHYLTNKMNNENQLDDYKDILHKDINPTPYNFSFTITDEDKKEMAKLEVDVVPQNLPPTNIHALIGGNGTGKTQLLIAVADKILNNKKTSIFEGELDGSQFSNLITVAFSTLDSFVPLSQSAESKAKIGYDYIGLKKTKNSDHDFKKLDDLNKEFQESINSCSNIKRNRWTNIIELLNTDIRFKELDLCNLMRENKLDDIVDRFRTLSSGHKIILFTLTKLVELVNAQTLVLIDEPENHLHPPLLATFIKAISKLLKERNGAAILATHSPVVLQEIPKSCVSIIHKDGNEIRITRPPYETFGESIGIITNFAFELEVQKSGYLQTLKQKIKDKLGYEEIMKDFNNQIGGEGRAILRTLLAGECDA